MFKTYITKDKIFWNNGDENKVSKTYFENWDKNANWIEIGDITPNFISEVKGSLFVDSKEYTYMKIIGGERTTYWFVNSFSKKTKNGILANIELDICTTYIISLYEYFNNIEITMNVSKAHFLTKKLNNGYIKQIRELVLDEYKNDITGLKTEVIIERKGDNWDEWGFYNQPMDISKGRIFKSILGEIKNYGTGSNTNYVGFDDMVPLDYEFIDNRSICGILTLNNPDVSYERDTDNSDWGWDLSRGAYFYYFYTQDRNVRQYVSFGNQYYLGLIPVVANKVIERQARNNTSSNFYKCYLGFNTYEGINGVANTEGIVSKFKGFYYQPFRVNIVYPSITTILPNNVYMRRVDIETYQISIDTKNTTASTNSSPAVTYYGGFNLLGEEKEIFWKIEGNSINGLLNTNFNINKKISLFGNTIHPYLCANFYFFNEFGTNSFWNFAKIENGEWVIASKGKLIFNDGFCFIPYSNYYNYYSEIYIGGLLPSTSDEYNQYISGIRNSVNASLKNARDNMTIGVLSGVKSMIGGIGMIGAGAMGSTFVGGEKVSNPNPYTIAKGVDTIGSGVIGVANSVTSYNNSKRSYDAQLQDARNSKSYSINSSNIASLKQLTINCLEKGEGNNWKKWANIPCALPSFNYLLLLNKYLYLFGYEIDTLTKFSNIYLDKENVPFYYLEINDSCIELYVNQYFSNESSEIKDNILMFIKNGIRFWNVKYELGKDYEYEL